MGTTKRRATAPVKTRAGDRDEDGPEDRGPVDPYRRRREAAAATRDQTRRRLVAAADALFREQGYASTTVSAIAERAGVSLPTLYLAWGSKSALFRAAADTAVADSGTPLTPEEWVQVIANSLAQEVGHDPGAPAYLAAVSRLFVQVAVRSAPYWQMRAEAAALEPELAAGHRQAMAQRRVTMRGVAARLPARGRRPELTDQETADTLWSIASPDVFALLTGQGSYTAAEFEAWLTRTLTAALCVESG